MHAPVEFADIAADVLARIKGRAPRVHCITNSVAQAYTANVLLAAGAVPSMTIAPEEIAAFVAGADALLVNLGTSMPSGAPPSTWPWTRRWARRGRAASRG
jgi:hydroxyethylthiazole kinase